MKKNKKVEVMELFMQIRMKKKKISMNIKVKE